MNEICSNEMAVIHDNVPLLDAIPFRIGGLLHAAVDALFQQFHGEGLHSGRPQ